MIKHFIAIIALLTVFRVQAAPVSADSLCRLEVYTLERCLREGLENNYSIRIVRNEQQMAANRATPANAGLLPTLDLTAGYGGDLNSTHTRTGDGVGQTDYNVYDQDWNARIALNWTLFDGMSLVTNYRQLQLLKQQGELQTRIVLEDFVAAVAAEYYNFVQQKIRLKNFRYAVSLSKERVRIVEARYHIGNFSRLDYQQAKVDFNADSAQYMKQQEALKSSCIRLNELMAGTDVDRMLHIRDTLIDVNDRLDFNQLWESTLQVNADLLRADQNTELARMDRKKVLSRNYPYVKLNAGYGYTHTRYAVSANRLRSQWGLNAGLTVGLNLFDGSRRTERRNADIALENSRLERQNLELSLRADMHNLWQAYENNVQMWHLERENLEAARENYEIAYDRYMLGDLSGFEMREAQKSLLDAEERILTAEYNTKMCEISLLQLSGNVMNYLGGEPLRFIE
ncbi:MAG: TolC family protein [Clostridium sp.]|nr:TolC family protein [Clostridium sp.]